MTHMWQYGAESNELIVRLEILHVDNKLIIVYIFLINLSIIVK